MSQYRIHLFTKVDRESVLLGWSELIELSAKHGLLPAIMYYTGLSRKSALKKPIDLSDHKAVTNALSGFLTEKAWTERILASSIWAPASVEENDYSIRFGLRGSGSALRVYSMLEADIDDTQILDEVLDGVRRRCAIDVIALQLQLGDPMIRAASIVGGNWATPEDNPECYQQLVSRASLKG